MKNHTAALLINSQTTIEPVQSLAGKGETRRCGGNSGLRRRRMSVSKTRSPYRQRSADFEQVLKKS
ncbi:hypothetical protein, partial [Chromobacterium haemolyticum]|uniref:hypothetical protein n=1 Tax=Chromobacterium haemolyticum TaxID=394935 RepID=UPI001C6319B4